MAGGAGPVHAPIRSQRRDWTAVLFRASFLVEKTILFFFFGRSCPSFLFSGAAHSECGVRTPLGGEGLSRTPPWPLGLQVRHALATGGLACALATLLGPPGAGEPETRPFLVARDSGLAPPHCHWFLTHSSWSPVESPFQGQEELKGKRSELGLQPPHGTSGSVIRFWSTRVLTVLALTHALRYGDPLPKREAVSPIFNATHWGEGTCDGPLL